MQQLDQFPGRTNAVMGEVVIVNLVLIINMKFLSDRIILITG